MRGFTADNFREAVHSFIRWADNHGMSLVEDDAIDRSLCSFMTNVFWKGK